MGFSLVNGFCTEAATFRGIYSTWFVSHMKFSSLELFKFCWGVFDFCFCFFVQFNEWIICFSKECFHLGDGCL